MFSSRLALRTARFANKSGLYKLGGSTASFRAPPHLLPWEVACMNHDQEGTLSVTDLHTSKFSYKGSQSSALTSAPTATYVTVTDEDFKRIPEGFCGELDTEFHFVFGDERKWMVRDSTKVVCRMLDNFKHRKLDQIGGDGPIHTSSRVDVNYTGLTDRPEWHDSVMNIECFGHSLLSLPKNSVKASGSRNIEYKGSDLVADYMESINEIVAKDETIPEKVMIAGPRGVGKSVTLNQAVLHARRNGWLVLFIPNGWDHAFLGSYVQPCLLEGQPFESTIAFRGNHKVVTDDDELEELELPPTILTDANTVYDNHEMSAQALRGFLQAHEAQLSKIDIRDLKILDKYQSYRADFNETMERLLSVESQPDKIAFLQLRAMIEGTDAIPSIDKLDAAVLKDFKYLQFQPKTLADLCTFGVAFRQLAGSLFIDLVSELREYNNPQMPVLVAVDGYNTWEVPSNYYYNSEPIMAKQMCVPHALNFQSQTKHGSDHWGLKNGMAIGTTTRRYVEGLKADFSKQKKSLPLCITVPHYSSKEYLSALSYYCTRDIFAPNLQLADMLGLRTFTASNPRLLRAEGLEFAMEIAIAINKDAAEEEAEEAARREPQENNVRRRLQDAGELDLMGDDDNADGSDDSDSEDEAANTPANKKAAKLKAKLKAEKEAALNVQRTAKAAAEAAKLSAKFNKPFIDAYMSNKDRKFLRMRDGRG